MKDPTLVWALWGAVAFLGTLVGAFIRAILVGALVPRTVLDRAHAEGDKWEQAWHTSQEALAVTVQQGFGEVGAQLTANTEGVRMMERIVDALVARGPAR
ncbi:hypothetical protein [Actinocorallia longicatena]|uniref:Uncharacterized protein n=1 Tax=Actinocorallia longicatena TaxID=111803 RepID=A0ABP6QHK5_9ACTN